jgi:hypothetical protein
MSRDRVGSLRVAERLLAVPLFLGLALGVPIFAQDQTISQMVHSCGPAATEPRRAYLHWRTPNGILGSTAMPAFLPLTA